MKKSYLAFVVLFALLATTLFLWHSTSGRSRQVTPTPPALQTVALIKSTTVSPVTTLSPWQEGDHKLSNAPPDLAVTSSNSAAQTSSNSLSDIPIVPATPPSTAKPAPIDPLARVALNFVGEDQQADAYWIAAINDPALPAEERKDLIEDLNEDGFADPKHPTPEEIPLILSRIALIEQLAPYAMDKTDSDAFAEAYQDLNDMLDGKTVR